MSESQRAFEERSRALFNDSVEGLDMPTLSRLTQARHAALAKASPAALRRSAGSRWKMWTPAVGVTAAAVLGVGLWLGGPGLQPSTAENQTNFEDLDLVASSEGAGDAMDMLQDDIEFYDFADKADGNGPTV